GVKVPLELGQAGLAGEGLVVAEEGEDDVGPCVGGLEAIIADALAGGESVRLGDRGRAGEPLVGRAERLRPQPQDQLVAGEAEVAEDEVMFGEATVEVGFQPAIVLHAVGERVADNADMIAATQLQFCRGGLVRGVDGPRFREERQAGEREGECCEERQAAGGEQTRAVHDQSASGVFGRAAVQSAGNRFLPAMIVTGVGPLKGKAAPRPFTEGAEEMTPFQELTIESFWYVRNARL